MPSESFDQKVIPFLLGAKKSTQTFFVQSFSTTLRVMDVRAENRGRPHQKVRFSAAPVVGRNFLTPGHPGVRVGNVRAKSGPKSLCLCFFFFLFFMPLDQSAAYILGLLQKRNSVFGPFWGNEEDLREQRKQKLHQLLVHFWGGGPFLLENWAKHEILAKMSAADRSNAKFMFLGSQASGHQALSALLKEQKTDTIRHSQAKSGIFRQNQGHDLHDPP